MPVLVTGATGVVGRALVPRLVSEGGQVRVYVRRDVPEYRALGVKVAMGEADHEGRLESALEQVHTIVHLVGGPVPERGVTVEWLNLETTTVALRAVANAGVRRFLFLSHVGAKPHSDHPYLAAKGKAEEEIRASGLEHAIFRCAPILASGSSLQRVLEAAALRPFGAAPGSGKQLVAPVSVNTVADTLVRADGRQEPVAGTWTIAGPEALTFDDLVERETGRRPARHGRAPGIPSELAQLYATDWAQPQT
jgi:uncharacterized protein YbjT (DUF2867 family)